MKKLRLKIILTWVIVSLVPMAVFASPVNVNRLNNDHIEPLQTADFIQGTRFVGTSTTNHSVFPFASSTSFSSTVLCLSTDCRTVWPTGGGSSYPFIPTINYAVLNQATTGIAWFQNGLNASSTSHFDFASTTLLTVGSNFLRSDATSTFTTGIQTPNINLTSSTASSTAANGLNLTGGCFAINGACLVDTNSGGTVTSVGTNNGLTGGTITTTGTVGLDLSKLGNTNTLLTWNGSQITSTGTPQLTFGYLNGTTTSNATSTLKTPLVIGNGDDFVFQRSGIPGLTVGAVLASGSSKPAIFTSGPGSFTLGYNANLAATDVSSINASGNGSFAGGAITTLNANGSTTSSGTGSLAYGAVSANGAYTRLFSSGTGSIALGDAAPGRIDSTNSGSFAGGLSANGNIVSSGLGSWAWGDNLTVSGSHATGWGSGYTNSTANTFTVGYGSTPTLTVTASALGVSTSTPFATLSVNPIAGQASNQFVVGSSTITNFIISNAGSVGIGTTTPNATLSIGNSSTNPPFTIPRNVLMVQGIDDQNTFGQNAFIKAGNTGYTTISSGDGSTAISDAGPLNLLGGTGIGSSAGGPINITAGSATQSTTVSLGASVNINPGVGTDGVFGHGLNVYKSVNLSNTGGTVGIGTSTPGYKLDIATTTEPQLGLSAGAGVAQWTFRNAGGNLYFATSTTAGNSTSTLSALTIMNQGGLQGNVGIATSTPGSLLSIGNNTGINFSLATSTFNSSGGINLTSGCFAFNGQCISGGGGGGTGTLTGNGIAGTMPAWTSSTNLVSTSTIIGERFIATSTIATSTLGGGVVVGNNGIVHNYSTGTTTVTSLEAGNLTFDNDAGAVAWINLPIKNAGASTTESYTAQLNGSSTITVYGQSNGNGWLEPAGPRVGIGTTSPWRTFDVNGTVGMKGLTGSSGLQVGILCLSGVNEVINESVACVASAERYKENIKNLSVGIDEVMKLRPVSFLWKKDFNGALQSDPNKNGTQYSLIADEVQKVDPNLVSVTTSTTTFEGKTYAPGTVEGLQDSNHWASLLVKAIQDIWNKVMNHESRITTLEKENQDLKKRLDKLEAKLK